MDKCILANGATPRTAKRVMAFKYGQMVRNMRVFGKLIWQKVLEDSFLPTEMFTKETGLTTKHMVRENTSMLKVPPTKEVGTKISKKDKAERSGQMDHTMKVRISEVRSMGKASFSGQMEQNIMDNGKITKCMDRENSNGQMVVLIKGTTQMIRSMDRGFILGLMEECTKADFIMENSMVKEYIGRQQAKKFTASGKEVKRAKYVKRTMNFCHSKIMSEYYF